MRVIKVFSFLIIGCLIGYYIYVVHTGEAQNILDHIRNLGVLGCIIGIAVQTLTNIIPVPGEFISIALMEIYGPVWGGLFAWIGGITGAVGALYLTKWIAKPFFANMAQPYLEKMDEFIQKREHVGLLLIRFVPFVPYHLVNYAAGILNVKLWGFIWTTAIGILPFTLAMSALYAGLRHGLWMWGSVGLGIVVILITISLYVSSHSRYRRNEQLNH
jgi:uncharacterized membrane protein YdjX (TVP38/TMEM64 family)